MSDYYREKLLAYYVGALEPDEASEIDKLLQDDPVWREAAAEAKRMELGLAPDPAPPPPGLADRTLALLRRNRTRAQSMLLAAAGVAAVLLLAFGVHSFLIAPPRGALLWRGPDELMAGGLLAPEAIVRAPGSGDPVPGIELSAVLLGDDGARTPLGSGRTNADGLLAGAWRLPDAAAGNYTLRVEARDDGVLLDSCETPVRVVRAARLALVPDRPSARPGEVIRARALFKRDEGGAPLADREVTFDLHDPAGNRLGQNVRSTTRYGLAWTEFPLDAELPAGHYALSARCDGVRATASFEVRRERLPIYEVSVRLDRPLFRGDEPVRGRIVARGFDGQAISGLRAEVRCAGREDSVSLDARGRGAFRLDPMSPGRRRLRVTVTDAAGQSVERSAVVEVGGDAPRFFVLPEAGELVPGVENVVYVVGRTPEGEPLQGEVTARIDGLPSRVTLDEFGIGIWRVSGGGPGRVTIFLPGAESPSLTVSLDVRDREAGLLVRTGRAVVAAGEEVAITVLSAKPEGRVLLAMKRDGRAVALGSAEVSGGRAATSLRVPRGVSGSVIVEATRIDGARASIDRRTLLVQGDASLRVRMRSDRATYRPGERARLSFEVLDAEGRGVPAALSVVGVDAALLAGPHPGLVQAMQATDVRALQRPGFPYDLSTPERARASVASLRQPTRRDLRRQLEDILPEDALDAETRAAFERMFAPDADEYDRRTLSYLLADLERMGHAATARALRDLAEHGSALGAGWVDQAPRARAEAAARRADAAKDAWIALLAVAILVGAFLLSRTRGTRAGVELAAFTVFALTVGIFAASIVGGGTALAGALLAAALVGHVAILFSRPSLRPAHQVAWLVLFYLGSGMALANGGGILLVLMAIVLAVLQSSAESVRTWWAGPLLLLFVLFILGSLVVVLIPKGQERSMMAEARFTARMVANTLDSRPDVVRPTAARHGSAGERVDVRDDFRETLLFLPELITDEQGRATVDAELPDSLTRWVLQADAITADGGLAHAGTSIVATQPLSLDLVLPTAVTEGDVLYVQAVVRNVTDAEHEATLRLDRPGAEPKTLRVAAHAVASVSWPVRFDAPGRVRLLVRSEFDAVARELRVERDARPVAFGASRRIDGHGSIAFSAPGAATASVRVHRGPLTQVIEGLDAMLAEPHGCFEQTSSINYPNIMVLRYLQQHHRADPALRARAEDLLSRGYQRLLRFEVKRSGGFSLYGEAPASVWLSAYGLMQLRDMREVFPVDPLLIERTQAYLIRNWDRGRWLGERAYIVWALGRDAPAAAVVALRGELAKLRRDPYLCALGALALQPHDPATAALLADGLAAGPLTTKRTVAWGRGSAETEALAALALLETGRHPDRARELIRKLPESCRPYGGWGSTHATVWALAALMHAPDRDEPLKVTVRSGDETIAMGDRRPVAPLAVAPGRGELTVEVEQGEAVVRVAGTAYVPWSRAVPQPETFALEIEFAKSKLTRGETVLGVARLKQGEKRLDVPMIEWGLPAGFRPVAGDLDAHVREGRVRRWEMSGRTLRLYLAESDEPLIAIPVRFAATARGRLASAPSRAYPYYESDRASSLAPLRFEID